MVDNPHDRLFKRTFSQPQHVMGELRAVLPPELVRQLDVSTLRLVGGSFVDEALSERHSDLLYEIRLAGRPVLVYLLFEHQSTVDKWMGFRLLRYMVRIWMQWLDDHPAADRLPVIIPIVLYHGTSGWTAPMSFTDLCDLGGSKRLECVVSYVPQFTYLVDDLSMQSNQDLMDRTMSAMGTLAVLLLKNAKHRPDILMQLAEWADAFRQVLSAPDGLRAIEAFVRYILEVSDHVTPEAMVRVLGSAVDSSAKEAVMNAAQRLIEQGIEQGIDKGRQRLLLKLMRLKFGELTSDVVTRVEQSRGDELDAWGERILIAATVEEVFALV